MPDDLEAPFDPGSVWLVGAGPGDPGLLTLHALSALRRADVVVHDALVDDRVLGMARRGAVLEYVGKRGGHPSPLQDDISRRLIDLARQGLRVVRLKGGDPFVFGRGGEEALALAEAGVPFRVVPGVTAGIGGLAYAGIPATHRTANQAVVLATGHASGRGPDWRALAAADVPIVLYMAWKALPGILAELRAGGMAEETPVAVVANATTPGQRTLATTVARAVEDMAASGIEPPAVVAIGRIVSLRDTLDWFKRETTHAS